MAINIFSDNTEIKNSLNIGSGNTASGKYSFAQGIWNIASGDYSHAEGYSTASGHYSHAEGRGTKAIGSQSHAEGQGTTAAGNYSHTEGDYTTANGDSSHAEGQSTMTNNYAEHASGSFNVSTLGVSQDLTALTVDSSATLFSIGNGTSSANTKNAFEVKWNGDIYVKKNDGTTVKLQDLLDRIP